MHKPLCSEPTTRLPGPVYIFEEPSPNPAPLRLLFLVLSLPVALLVSSLAFVVRIAGIGR